MKNDILFITATHGDELVGYRAVAELKKTRADFDTLIGNPAALAAQTRYTECDLNRAAPGKPESPRYEERRAAEVLTAARNYRYTIDLHGTVQNTGIFLLVTNPTLANLRLASYFDIQNLVVWPSVTPEMQYPMSEFFPCGLEIESGPQNNPDTQSELQKILNDFLDNYREREKLPLRDWENRLHQKNLYEMYGSIPTDEGLNATQLQEFQTVTHRGETFAPVFVGVGLYKNILGYKLKIYSPNQFSKKFLN